MTEPTPWMPFAESLVGLKEIIGSKHEKKVLEFYAEAGNAWVHDDETPWCAAFVNSMLYRAGIKGTNSLAARSFLKWGKEVKDPFPGCIVVFKRGADWQGHVAFFKGIHGDTVETLGGNQANSVSIGHYKLADVLGYRMPA